MGKNTAGALQLLFVIWPRGLVQNSRGKKPPNVGTHGFSGLIFIRETLSLPLCTHQALLSIGTYLKYATVSLVIQESAIGGK